MSNAFFLIEQKLRALPLRANGALREFTLIREGRPLGAIGPDYFLLQILYRTVRRLKPKVVVEFGSGWSTFFIARALAANAVEGRVHGHLYSVDAEERWADTTRSGVPERLRPFCTITYSPTEEVTVGGTRTLRHVAAPSVEPDLMFVDGPAFRPPVAAVCDAINFERRIKRGFPILIDKRERTTAFLIQNLRTPYRHRRVRGLIDRAAIVNYFEPTTA